MSRAISSRRKRLRISWTTVEFRVARAIARWNFRSSWRKRSSCLRKSSSAASSRLRSISAAMTAKSSSLACTAASCATRGSSSRRASSTPATSLTRIAWRLRSRSRGTSSDAMKMPPDWPRRTSSTPASTSVFTASRSVGRLIRMIAASSRSDGRRSPTCRSPALIRSAICSTASSKVRRDETGSNELSKPTSSDIGPWEPGRWARIASRAPPPRARAPDARPRRSAWCPRPRRSRSRSRGAPWRRRSSSASPRRSLAVPLARRRGSGRRSWPGSPARRGCRAPSSVRATARPVSGLFAAPATTRQSIERASASSISPPAAQGASTSSSLARIASADGATSMPCSSATRRCSAGVEVAADHVGARLHELRGERGADLAQARPRPRAGPRSRLTRWPRPARGPSPGRPSPP